MHNAAEILIEWEYGNVNTCLKHIYFKITFLQCQINCYVVAVKIAKLNRNEIEDDYSPTSMMNNSAIIACYVIKERLILNLSHMV